jgi:hypothetical protein
MPNRSSVQIAALEAVPLQHLAGLVGDGNLRVAVGTVEIVNADAINDVMRLVRLPSGAVVHEVLIFCDAITSAATDIGLHRTSRDGGAVVDRDFFASAVSIATAIVTGTNHAHEADPTDAGVGFGLADVAKPLWEALGLAADPNLHYDVTATLTAAATATGTLSVKVFYSTNA